MSPKTQLRKLLQNLPRIELDQTKGKCKFTSVNFTSVNFTSVNFTSVNFTSVNFTSVNFTSVNFTSVSHFTSVGYIRLLLNAIVMC